MSYPRVLLRAAEGGTTAAAGAAFGESMVDAVCKNSQTPKVSRHFEFCKVRLEEMVDETGSTSVVLGPDTPQAIPGSSEWTLPFARATEDPAFLSTTCPTVALASEKWYERQDRWRDFVRLGVVAAVLDPDGRVLLTRRARHMRSFPRAWVMPGGGVDEGEGLVDAVAREVLEETGVSIMKDSAVPVGLWESAFPTSAAECIAAGTGITAHYLVVFFLARAKGEESGRLKVNLHEVETDLATWLSAEDFSRVMSNPLGGADGSLPAALEIEPRRDEVVSVTLDELSGIYPRGDAMCGIAQGNLFMLEELFRAGTFA